MDSRYSFLILGLIFTIGAIAETFFPLRNKTQPKLIRFRRNLGVAAVSAILMRLMLVPGELIVAQYVENNQIGLLNKFDLSSLKRTFLAIILLDYTLYF